MHDFRKLDVSRLAMVVARNVYRLTAEFPDEERYGLTSQMRRAAISIASNIAEGVSRQSHPDVRRFLAMARGSSAELESNELADNLDQVRAMLVRLGRNLATSPN